MTLLLLVGLGAAANAALKESDRSRPSEDWRGTLRISECHVRNSPTCVVDGDTIRMNGDKIRISDIDAPEVFSPACRAERALGEQATTRLVELINSGPVELVRIGRRDRDRYGRKLRVIARDGRSLGRQLVREGLANPWDGAKRSWC